MAPPSEGKRLNTLSPQVVACGHRHILTKSGHSFPAFLVRFPCLDSISSSKHTNSYDNHNPAGGTCRYFWRTKRDFLLLSRSLRKHNVGSPFPKKAFAKLSAEASLNDLDNGIINEDSTNRISHLKNECRPWVRPDVEETPEYFITVKQCIQESCNGDIEANFNQSILNFKPVMKKSLYQLDTFLSTAQNVFITNLPHHSMKYSKTSSSSKEEKYLNQKEALRNDRFQAEVDEAESGTEICSPGIIESWTIFCRCRDSGDLVTPQFGGKEEYVDDSTNSKNKKQQQRVSASQLGQYFASEQNAKVAVDTLFNLLRSNGKIDFDTGLVFVEPSCGDGRLINQLLVTLADSHTMKSGLSSNLPQAQTTQHNMFPSCIVGYDIDPIVIEKSRRKLQHAEVVLRVADFLALKKCHLIEDISQVSCRSTNDACSSPNRRRCSEYENTLLNVCDKTQVVVIGGPPYTPKCLPEKFILHSIQELNAEIVIFILPERCRKDVEKIQRALNLSCEEGGDRWCCLSKELGSSLFTFQESLVSQPSILQCWHKKNDGQ